MYIRIWSFFLLFCLECFSISVYGSEFNRLNFDGMQLAWTRVPGTSSSEDVVLTPKPRIVQPTTPKPASQPTEVKSPTSPPTAVNPVQPATVVPAQPIIVKPVQAPIAKPISQPISQPALTQVTKSAHPSALKSSQSFKWMIGLGAEIGGEELGTVTYSDGSTASVKANNGIVLNFGAVMPNGNDSAFATQLTVGYKSGGPRLWSNDVNWSAIPVEIIEQYRSGNFRMGLGISYQLNPKLRVSLPASNFINTYKNAIGLIAQIGWAPARSNYIMDLRYTSIKFQSSDVPDAPLVNGNVAGLYLNYFF